MSNKFWHSAEYPFIEIRRTEDSPTPYKPHSHQDFLSIGAVEHGETVMSTTAKDITLRSGMLTFFNPGVIHSCNPIPGQSRTYSIMHLSLSWCTGIQREMLNTAEFLPLTVSTVSDTLLYEEYNNVVSSALAGEPFYDDLISLLSNIFGRYCTSDPQPDVSSELLAKTEEYIRKNVFEHISLDDLAKEFRQNRFHLLRSFRSQYGLPPHAYQMDIRIQKAKQMLREGMPIADVAAATGFTDQSHFHRIFKKHTAATPGEFSQ